IGSTLRSSRLHGVDLGASWCVARHPDRAKDLHLLLCPGNHPFLPGVVRFYFIETVRLYFIVDRLRGKRVELGDDGGAQEVCNLVGVDGTLVAQDKKAFDEVLELPDVAGPIVAPETLQRFERDCAWRSPEFTREAIQEQMSQRLDVVAALTEGGQMHRHD